jgi:hypothetical protein
MIQYFPSNPTMMRMFVINGRTIKSDTSITSVFSTSYSSSYRWIAELKQSRVPLDGQR